MISRVGNGSHMILLLLMLLPTQDIILINNNKYGSMLMLILNKLGVMTQIGIIMTALGNSLNLTLDIIT